jgi:hypothetical protein
MELTRRDALAALAASGVAVGGGVLLATRRGGDDADERPIGTEDLDALVALAEVLYPSETTGIAGFVESYVLGRVREREAYRTGMADALAALDEHAREWYGGAFVDLSREDRDALLAELGVETADPDPDGRTPERIRYYLVNDLLFAFYASPTGGELVGIENPQGHPGGIESYQRGPDG